ncbi:MAG TPA: TlpA disulfide reductase family protein [Bacteroidota bacterium]|nr:TlpA disulfide reductase family protein [Bacteroidota bacterium]
MREIRLLRLLFAGLLVSGLAGTLRAQVATFEPQNPKIGERIVVTYDAGKQTAAIRNTASLTLRTLVLRDQGAQPLLLETPMEKSGNSWRASFALSDPGARYLLHQFVSGDLKDDNGEQGWGGMVVDTDGKPMRQGRYWHAAVEAFGGYMGYKFRKDVADAKTELAAERKLFPDDYSAVNLVWYLATNPLPTPAGTGKVKKELPAALKLFRKNEEALPMFLIWYDQVGERVKADSLRKIFMTENPKGRVSASIAIMGLSTENDPSKKIRILEHHLAQFPLKEEDANSDRHQLVLLYAQQGEYEKAYGTLKAMTRVDPALYKGLVTPMIEKGNSLEKGVMWATEGIDLIRKKDESARPPATPVSEWTQAQQVNLAALLQLRGHAYTKLGKHGDAETDFAEACEIMRGKDVSLNLDLIQAYCTTEKFQKAEELGLQCIRKEKSNLAIVEKLKSAYTKNHGSLNGYDKAVLTARRTEQAELLKSGTVIPAPEFSLRTLGGGTVRLEDQRGKIVVVAFWSTWSGTSKEMLLQLQKVFEAYQYYRTVSFVTLNTGETVAGAARDTLVKKTMTSLKCSLPVAFDDSPGFAEKYAIDGIPTAYVLDRNGAIRFKHVGFRDGKELVNDLMNEIEVLLKN